MAFDRNDERIREILDEEFDARPEDASEVERNPRNFMDIQENEVLSFISLRVKKTPFNREEFVNVIETEISSLS